jgi:glycine cleavage system H protein
VGITDYAAKTLNDVVYVTAPKVGAAVLQFGAMGTVESIKAVSELYSPFSGTVTRVNAELEMHPELVNKSPYSDGWLIELKPSNLQAERTNLLDSRRYREHLDAVSKK